MPYSKVTTSHPVFSLSTGNAITAPSNQKVNGGSIRFGGTIASSLWLSKPLGDALRIGNIVFQTTLQCYQKLVSAATFNFQNVPGKYVIRRVTTTLAGQANTALQSGGSDSGFRRSVKYVESLRVTVTSAWKWDGQTGTDGHPVYTRTLSVWSGLAQAYGNDNAARASMSSPGQLVYLYGNPTPKQDTYKAKTD